MNIIWQLILGLVIMLAFTSFIQALLLLIIKVEYPKLFIRLKDKDLIKVYMIPYVGIAALIDVYFIIKREN